MKPAILIALLVVLIIVIVVIAMRVMDKRPRARVVRIDHPAARLSFVEAQVFSGDKNVALAGTATQNSTAHTWGQNPEASSAIDGNTAGYWTDGSTTHTGGDLPAWWQVDLGKAMPIDRVVIYGRTDYPVLLAGATLSLLDSNGAVLAAQTLTDEQVQEVTFA